MPDHSCYPLGGDYRYAFKLLRMRKDRTLGPLFFDRDKTYPLNLWLQASHSAKGPKGFAFRPGFHCCLNRKAPQLKLRLATGEVRIWCTVLISNFSRLSRPESQGGMWFVAEKMFILTPLEFHVFGENASPLDGAGPNPPLCTGPARLL